jgi:hypothetical protein
VVRGDGVPSSARVQAPFIRALLARNNLCHVGIAEDHETRDAVETPCSSRLNALASVIIGFLLTVGRWLSVDPIARHAAGEIEREGKPSRSSAARLHQVTGNDARARSLAAPTTHRP